MAVRFEIEAEGLSGIPYRIRIFDNQFSGSVTELTADIQFIRFEGGEDDDIGLHPAKPLTARIFVRDDADLSALFDRQDTEVPVEVWDLGVSQLVLDGYMVTDFFSDAPFINAPLVEIRVYDGLPLLRDNRLDDTTLTNNERFTYTDAFAEILNTNHNLDIELGVELWPESNGVLTANDCPLEYTTVHRDNFYEDREAQDKYMNLYDVLLQLLISQGCTIRQHITSQSLVWHIRQREAIDTSGTPSIQVWTVDSNGTVTGPDDNILVVDMSNQEFDRKHTRSFLRRRQSVVMTHDHVGYKDLIPDGDWEGILLRDITGVDLANDEFIVEKDWTGSVSVGDTVVVTDQGSDSGSYEVTSVTYIGSGTNETHIGVNGDLTVATTSGYITNSHWDVTNPTTSNDWEGQVVKHFTLTGDDGTQKPASNNNARTLEIQQFTNEQPEVDDFVVEQTLNAFEIPEGAYGRIRISWNAATAEPNGFPNTCTPIWHIETTGGYFLQNQEVAVQDTATEGRGQVVTDPLPVPLPSGSVLYAGDTSTDQPDTTFRVTEAAEKGATELIGEVRSRIPSGKILRFVGFSPSSGYVNMHPFTPEDDTWLTADLYFSPIASDGTHVDAANTVRVGATFGFLDSNENYNHAFIDDILYYLERDGQILDQTVVTGTVPEFGETDSITGRVFSGPKVGSISSVRGLDPSGNIFDAAVWGTDPAATEQLTLQEILVQRRLRYMRENLKRFDLDFYRRGLSSQIINMGDVIEFGTGEYYTIQSMRFNPQSGVMRLRLLRLNDYDDTGTITLETVASVEEAGGGTTVISSAGAGASNATLTDLSDPRHWGVTLT